jgi:uncharacterized protein YndB with AHSA1/START domain
MGDYEATGTVDVAANVLFEYLSDVERLPEYLPQLTEAHRVGEDRVEVEAVVDPEGEPRRTEHGEAWIEVVEDGRKLRWGAPGPHEYHGELDVDFVADGTSRLTVRLHTDHTEGPSVDEALRRTLAGIKTAAEHHATHNRPSA